MSESMHSGVLASAADLGYGPIFVLIVLAIVVSAAILVVTHVMPKAKRHGDVKEGTYESGVEVIGDARRRFNVRFYLVAMLFLLFDVELIFMYPWAVVYFDARSKADAGGAAASLAGGDVAFLFFAMAIFFLLLLIGFAYDWGKGILRYD
ncbi:MAG: NADH-quinone oxidoreductase subunit A [Planctomycetota bacterium]